MPEWIAVILFGALGGLIHGLRGQRVLKIPYVARDHRGHLYCDFGTLGVVLKAVFNGAVAGLVFWGMYDATAAWTTQVADVRVTVVSLVVGIGGDRFLTMVADKQLNDTTAQDAGEAFGRLTDPDPTGSQALDAAQSAVPVPSSAPKPTRRPRKRKR